MVKNFPKTEKAIIREDKTQNKPDLQTLAMQTLANLGCLH